MYYRKYTAKICSGACVHTNLVRSIVVVVVVDSRESNDGINHTYSPSDDRCSREMRSIQEVSWHQVAHIHAFLTAEYNWLIFLFHLCRPVRYERIQEKTAPDAETSVESVK